MKLWLSTMLVVFGLSSPAIAKTCTANASCTITCTGACYAAYLQSTGTCIKKCLTSSGSGSGVGDAAASTDFTTEDGQPTFSRAPLINLSIEDAEAKDLRGILSELIRAAK